jgi:hypothetical protein
MRARWCLLVAALASGCARQELAGIDLELDTVGRYLQAKTWPPDARYRLLRELSRNPLLSREIHVARYTVESGAEPTRYDLTCATDRAGCKVEGLPALDRGKRSRLGEELRAVWRAMRGDHLCDEQKTIELQRAPYLRSGNVEVRVRCGDRARWYTIECSEKGCGSAGGWGGAAEVEREKRIASRGYRWETCFGGVGKARLEPAGPRLDGDSLNQRFPDLLAAYRAIGGVRTAGLAPCCETLEHGTKSWCLWVYVGDRWDAAIDEIAAARPSGEGALPPLVIDGPPPD